jgi:hypothetical protein
MQPQRLVLFATSFSAVTGGSGNFIVEAKEFPLAGAYAYAHPKPGVVGAAKSALAHDGTRACRIHGRLSRAAAKVASMFVFAPWDIPSSMRRIRRFLEPVMRTMRHRGLPLMLLACVVLGRPAQAAEFCANTPATFQAALTAAQGNGQSSNVIKVVEGTYNLTSGLTYIIGTTSSLFLVGGYSAGCASYTGGMTQLNGQNAVRPLRIVASQTDVLVQGFDFAAGLSTNNRGGGLSISSNLGDILVERNSFYGNRADDFAGALFVSTGGVVTVSNNLFFGNSAADVGAAELFSNSPESYVTNNTVSANSADTASAVGGLILTGATHYNVSNNIVWNNNANGAIDFRSNTIHLRLNNDIGSSAGVTPDAASTGNLSVVPVYESCGFLCISFALVGDSPLVNAGRMNPPGGLTNFDVLGRPRVVGGIVDIGAVEYRPLFESGFEEAEVH